MNGCEILITGLSSEISAQLPGSADLSATKADGLIFESVLSGIIKGKEAATIMQEEPSVFLKPQDPEESADQETTEQAYLNLFPYRILQDGKSSVVGRNVPTAEKADQTGTWLGSVAEKQMVITHKLDYSIPAAETPTRPEEIEAGAQPESFPLSDTDATATSSRASEAGEPASIPKSRLESDAPLTVDAEPESKRAEQSFELQMKETTIRQPSADEEEMIDSPEASAKTADSHENKAQLNQGMPIRDLVTENVIGHKPSKVTASHIEDIQKTIEMQIEKTPELDNTVVKIRLTPDNIGDIHVQLIKTKNSITAVLHVKDTETKGLLEDQLPLLLEPFKHGVSEGPITLTVVADPSLAFSFSEGADPGNRKAERQESRKRTTKDKAEAKEETMTKQSSRGLSLLA